MNRVYTCTCIVGFVIGFPSAALAQIDSPAPQKAARVEYQTATKAYLRFLEARVEMKTKLRDKGVGCGDDADFYRFQVAIIRHCLALVEDRQDEAREQFRVAVTVREAQHGRVKRLQERGSGFEAEIQVAERQ
jgi:hypothetical protein